MARQGQPDTVGQAVGELAVEMNLGRGDQIYIEEETSIREPENPFDMTEEDVVDLWRNRWQNWEETYEYLHNQWESYWNAYNNQIDYSAKEDWMAKVTIPTVRSLIKKAVSIIRHIVMRDDNYIKFKPVQEDPEDQEQSPFGDDAENARISTKAVKIYQKASEYLDVLLEVVEGALALGCWWMKLGFEPTIESKVVSTNTILDDAGAVILGDDGRPIQGPWRIERVDRRVAKATCEAVDPRNLAHDPDHRWFIHRTSTTLDQLLETAEADPAVYNPEQVAKLKDEDYENIHDEDRLRRIGLIYNKGPNDKNVVIEECMGHIVNDKGLCVRKGVRLIIANEQHILNWPTKNYPNVSMDIPCWSGEPQLYQLNAFRQVGRKEGTGLAEPIVPLWEAECDLLNLGLDFVLLRLLGFPQVVVDWLENPEDAENLEPGKPVWLSEESGGKPAILDIQTRDLPGSVRYISDKLDREVQKGAMVPDSLLGMVKGNITATQNQNDLQTATGYFESVGKDIENFIAKTSEGYRQLIMEYGLGDDSDPNLLRILEREIQGFMQMSEPERIMFLQSDMDVEAKGISEYFRMSEVLKVIMDFLEMGDKWKPLGRRIQPWKAAETIINNLPVPVAQDLLISEDDEKALRELEMRQLAAELNQHEEATPDEKTLLANQITAKLQGIPPERRASILPQLEALIAQGGTPEQANAIIAGATNA